MSMLPIKKINDPEGSGKCYPLSVLEASVITSRVVVGTQIGGYNKGDVVPICTTLDEIIKKILAPNENDLIINNWREASQTNTASSQLIKTSLDSKEDSGTAQNLLDTFKQQSFNPLSNLVNQHSVEVQKISDIISRLDTIYSNDGTTGILKELDTQVDNLETKINNIYNSDNQTGTLKNLIDRVDTIYSSDGTTGILKNLSDTVNDNLLSKIKGAVYQGDDAPINQDKYDPSTNPVVLKKALDYYIDVKIQQSEGRSGSAVQLVGIVNSECEDYNDYAGCETISDVWTIYQEKHSDKYPLLSPQNGYLLLWDDDEYLYCKSDNSWHPYGNLDGTVKSGEIADVDIANDANISQSKINGLTTALNGKQNTITAGGGLKFDENDTSTLKHSNAAVNAQTSSGLYKITHDGYGHITESTAVQKSDITALGIPGQDTTYSEFSGANGTTAGTAGLVKAPTATDNTKFLKGDGTWADPVSTPYTAGSGLSLSGTTFNHSNSVTAQTTSSLLKIAHDAQGHITASNVIGDNDIVLKSSNIQNLTQQLSYITGIMNALNSLVFPGTYKADLTTDDGIAVAVKAILMKLGVLEENIDI